MLFPLERRHRFRCALLGGTSLGGPNARLDDLWALYELMADDGIETVFLTGGATSLPVAEEIDYLANHYPRMSGIKTYYPCIPVAQGMARAGRGDWQYLPPTIYLLVQAGMQLPCTFAYEPDSEPYAQACRQPLTNGPIDSLRLFAGMHCRGGEVDHRGSHWLVRSGAFSAAPGTTLPVTASYLDLRIGLEGRINPEDRILTTFQF